MRIYYNKMQAAGNRIVVVDRRGDDPTPPTPQQIKLLGNDATGPGFDQLMWVFDTQQPGSLAAYRVFNNDGTECEQCGNGVRCVARVLANDGGANFTLQSPPGPIEVKISAGGDVSVSMGAPVYEASSLIACGQSFDVSLVSMGNPHCVLQIDDVQSADVATLGPAIENHERFPERINVGFMHVRDRSNIDLRVHERGAGETLACGTGASAAVVAGQRLGLLGSSVNVFLPGGQLVVSWRGASASVWLSGPAELLSEGFIDL
jgi:diaminopimelate epimerase